MLDGWYCRSLANEQTGEQNFSTGNNDNNEESDSDSQENNDVQNCSDATNTIDYKVQYRQLKRKLKFLIYENEFFQETLRTNQRRLLKVSRDRAFLLDRLLQYEKPTNSSSESEQTEESSDDDATKEIKKKKLEENGTNSTGANSNRGRKKKVQQTAITGVETTKDASNCPQTSAVPTSIEKSNTNEQQQHINNSITREEKTEMQLAKHSILMDMIPEKAPPTVPAEMFSNEPSLDSETNEMNMMDVNSPAPVAITAAAAAAHINDCTGEECVTMEYSNQ